ncbi:MAG: glycoside hydrolase family 99-like domain-containing protein [Thermoguttaceae bacterium]|nr:glycoside hydrolase family 99-like domain-containing protein [Thermoguttaceae bacterium]
MNSFIQTRDLRAVLAFAFVLSFVVGFRADASEPQTLLSWDFNTQADVDAWGKNCLSKPVAKDGSYCADYTDWDPFVVSPQFNIKPAIGQFIEIRMKSTGFHTGEVFFASSNEGQYNGFSQSKTASWDIIHDGKWHTYQIMPAWLQEPQIIKIRVDLGRPTEEELKKGANVEIDYIRILSVDFSNAAEFEKNSWTKEELDKLAVNLNADANGWESEIGLIDPEKVGSNLYLEFERDPAIEAIGPFPRASLRFLTDVGSGVVSLEAPLFNVGSTKPNRYAKNVDLSAFSGWGSKVFRWELSLPKELTLKKIEFTKDPIGEGVVETQGNGEQIALARLGDKGADLSYEIVVRNSGGAALDKFRLAQNTKTSAAKLTGVSFQKIDVDPLLGFNPTGDRLASKGVDSTASEAESVSVDADKSGAVQFPADATLAPGEAYRILAKFNVSQQGITKTKLTLNAGNQSIDFEPQLNVLQALNVPKMDYVPEPQDLESDYEIGAYYFPGWSKRSGWDKIDEAAPIRKPLLGYYDEGNPEVVDWQIKWAAENGIKFFFVDWYWKKGRISLDHWVRAFQQAKYRSHLKWAIMWANHTGYGTHTSEDWEVVTQYWLDNYFNTPEYYTIDGKPVVVMWDTSIVDHDMIEEAKAEGLDLKPGEGCKRAIEIVRKKCVEAGYPGVYFIAMKFPEHAVDPATVQKYADQGFDATTIYHFMYPGKDVKDSRVYSFEQVAKASKVNWDERWETGILPTIPNISTGWDSRPWHGFRSTVVYGRNVETFRSILKDYKEYAKETGNKRVVLAPLNEWGEGSYIEPNNEFGFGMYEAIREELCKEPEGGFPVNYAPYEVGLGPYDLPKEK